jgi:hypothetical protein
MYTTIVVNIALLSTLGKRKLGSARRKQGETGNVSPQLCPKCGWTMWDIAERRITNEETRRTAGPTINGIDDGNAKMPMAIQTQHDGRGKISEANAWRMVSNTTSDRETAADHTPRLHNHPKTAEF